MGLSPVKSGGVKSPRTVAAVRGFAVCGLLLGPADAIGRDRHGVTVCNGTVQRAGIETPATAHVLSDSTAILDLKREISDDRMTRRNFNYVARTERGDDGHGSNPVS